MTDLSSLPPLYGPPDAQGRQIGNTSGTLNECHPVGCQCPACKSATHLSDCAVHNEPALPNRPCDCPVGFVNKAIEHGHWEGCAAFNRPYSNDYCNCLSVEKLKAWDKEADELLCQRLDDEQNDTDTQAFRVKQLIAFIDGVRSVKP